jgi:hypothetical protein
MITSSTKRICNTFINLETLIPETVPLTRLSFSIKLRPSITRIKSNEDSGHPWRTPLPQLKKSVASPFIKTEKDVEVTQDIIQFVNLIPAPIFKRINLSIPNQYYHMLSLNPVSIPKPLIFSFLCCAKPHVSCLLHLGSSFPLKTPTILWR